MESWKKHCFAVKKELQLNIQVNQKRVRNFIWALQNLGDTQKDFIFENVSKNNKKA